MLICTNNWRKLRNYKKWIPSNGIHQGSCYIVLNLSVYSLNIALRISESVTSGYLLCTFVRILAKSSLSNIALGSVFWRVCRKTLDMFSHISRMNSSQLFIFVTLCNYWAVYNIHLISMYVNIVVIQPSKNWYTQTS